ncbi:uncharacterized protein C8R40DRAFT_624262 [Lentinula edodes]|uniref:uncharacterized protein n=1 Tax=Lentinula edodes TaxID=5353 RepID=UPI001E8CC14B|nr:uncharacterized protein C8R40DRAFT_624262 [Lentinula edodes]KAH7870746.1 hypothetical protein C8R40DRAFT_624262 [Lentinula edodes]
MQRSPNPSVDPHDAHLRRLLDQRATRADLHSRVPSLSEFSDTPSLYSHAYFSPQPPHFNSNVDELSSNFASPIRSDRDRFNDLAVSMLDMDDEPRSSYSSNEYDDMDGGDQSTVEQHQEEEDELAMPRLSLLGPKMRFHSKAPWELDDSVLQQDEESEDDMYSHSVMSSTTRNKGGAARHFRFGGSKLGNNNGRSSRESSRSRRVAKKSFDTTSSQTSYGRSAIHTLAQASLSSTSLVPGGPHRPFSPAHAESPSSAHFSPSSPRSPVFPGRVVEGTTTTRSSGSGESEPRPSFAYSVEDTHPYARSNPSAPLEHDPRALFKKIDFPNIPRSETVSTLTNSTASYTSINQQPQISLSVQPTHEPLPQSPRLQAFGREISSPVAFRSTTHTAERADFLPPRTGNISGWTERAVSPSFNLISLEEARAQRSRSITSQSTTTHPSSSVLLEDRQNEQISSHSVTSRARARSISAGARAKQALTSMVGNTPPKQERRGSEPAVVVAPTSDSKVLKHKKSGLMRLFNGGRDEKTPPPPVPSLSEGFAAFNAQQSTVPKGLKVNRVPPPQVSPSMFEKSHFVEESQISSPKPTTSPKRTPPPLNIVDSNHVTGTLRPQFHGEVAQSAPANVTEFPSLKLRPISTVFSSHFGDHILPSPSSDDEPDTPSSLQSPITGISPVTPGPFSRPNEQNSHQHKTSSGSGGNVEDQSAVIRALQDQIVTAKRAWQRQIWELEGQVRDLKVEVEDLRNAGNVQGYCELCGRGIPNSRESSGESSQGDEDKKPGSVVNRPRARTGTGQSRFGSAV